MRVRAVNGVGDSDGSALASATPGQVPAHTDTATRTRSERHRLNRLPNHRISDAAIANLFAKAGHPQHHKTTILAFARHPETYTRPDIIQQTKSLLYKVVESITVSRDDIVIHYAIPLPDCKLRLGRYYGFATPQSQIF